MKKTHQTSRLTSDILKQRAKEYAQVEEKTEVKGELKEFLGFRLGKEWYLLEMELINEVLSLTRLSRLPHASELVSGVVNVRGAIVLVMDLAKLLHVPTAEHRDTSRFIFLKTSDDITGFLADEVSEIFLLGSGDSQPPIATITGLQAEFITGLFDINGKPFVWLDMERILVEVEARLLTANNI